MKSKVLFVAITLLILCLNRVSFASFKRAEPGYFIFSGHLNTYSQGDSILLEVWEKVWPLNKLSFITSKKSKVACADFFKLKITNVSSHFYYTVSYLPANQEPANLVFAYLAQSGDSLVVDYSSLNPKFERSKSMGKSYIHHFRPRVRSTTGRGRGAFKVQFEIDSSTLSHDSIASSQTRGVSSEKGTLDSSYYLTFIARTKKVQVFTDSLIASQQSILNHHKDDLSTEIYQLLELDLIGEAESNLLRSTKVVQSFIIANKISEHFRDSIKNIIREQYLQRKQRSFNSLPPSFLKGSKGYMNFLALRASYAEWLWGINPYQYILQSPSSDFRDILMTTTLLSAGDYFPNRDSIFLDALSKVKDELCFDLLDKALRSSQIGKFVSTFSATDTHDQIVEAKSFLGKIVFIDFWYTGCAGCSSYFQSDLIEVENHYKDNSDIIFLSCSVDESKSTWLNSIKSGKYTSDGHRNVINLYTGGLGKNHSILKELMVHAYPRPILIDRNGKIFNGGNGLKGKEFYKTIDLALSSK